MSKACWCKNHKTVQSRSAVLQITSNSTKQLFSAVQYHVCGQQASQAGKVKLQVSWAAEGHESGQAIYAARLQMHFAPSRSSGKCQGKFCHEYALSAGLTLLPITSEDVCWLSFIHSVSHIELNAGW